MSEVLPEAVVNEPVQEVVAEAPAKEIIGLMQYLKKEMAEGKIDFAFRAAETEDGHIWFYVHPLNANGGTADFYLNDQGHVFPINQPGPLKAAAEFKGAPPEVQEKLEAYVEAVRASESPSEGGAQ